MAIADASSLLILALFVHPRPPVMAAGDVRCPPGRPDQATTLHRRPLVPATGSSLIVAVARCLGWRRAYADTTEVDAVLTQQTDLAYSQAPDLADIAAARHDELAVQPCLMDIRARVLADFVYLEAVLADARSRRLAPELIRSLRAVVGHSRDLTVLLADAVRTTAVIHADSH
ncbi:hypothetical protein [Streptomyces sp. NPDC006333]|uniref:hypothetical protein n=1 Tax=Streptomyces sp. NPDC006333 TaxID=3156753 RepID=UPI0033AA8AFD